MSTTSEHRFNGWFFFFFKQKTAYEMTPSEMFHRQCYMTGWYDRSAIEARQYLGVDNVMWETNFPQATSTWPTTRDRIAQSFQSVPEDERAKMLWGNAAQLYKLVISG